MLIMICEVKLPLQKAGSKWKNQGAKATLVNNNIYSRDICSGQQFLLHLKIKYIV